MAIVLIRHAQAAPEDRERCDEDRFLTQFGRGQARDLGALLAEVGVPIGAFVTSPLVRATQTAELVASRLEYGGVIESMPSLAPRAVSMATLAALEELSQAVGGQGALFAVGHEPTMSTFAGRLVGDSRLPSFSTAEACLIDGGELCWRLSPS